MKMICADEFQLILDKADVFDSIMNDIQKSLDKDRPLDAYDIGVLFITRAKMMAMKNGGM